MRNDSAGNDPVTFVAIVKTTDDNQRLLWITTDVDTDTWDSGSNYYLHIGTEANGGDWTYLDIDLAGRIEDLSTGETFESASGLVFYAAEDGDLYVDDIVFASGYAARTHALNPWAPIGAYLGVQAGAGGDGGSVFKMYHQYNDLGTVMATTGEGGSALGVYETTHYGELNVVSGGLYDAIGLTSKLYDGQTGLYYFNARWYDAERGRWMSEEPLGLDGPNLYHFSANDPINRLDPNGLNEAWWPTNGSVDNDAGNQPVRCINMDTHNVHVVPPGKNSPWGTDIDFVETDGKWFKIPDFSDFDVGPNGEPDDGYRPVNPEEQGWIDRVLQEHFEPWKTYE